MYRLLNSFSKGNIMSKYIPIQEFKKKTETLSRAIEKKILSGPGFENQLVLVNVNVVKDGDCIPWRDPDVKGVVISNKPPEIYHDASIPLYIQCLGVKVVVHVEDIVYENNPLNLPWKSYTFDRYEDYLKLLSNTYLENQPDNKEPVSVRTTIKETNTPLAFFYPPMNSANCRITSILSRMISPCSTNIRNSLRQ